MLRALVDKFSVGATDPGAMLTRINRNLLAILKQTGITLFATGFYLVADAAQPRLRYANAGHPDPLLLHRRQGVLEQVGSKGSTGPALGLFEHPEYRTCECPMAVDDFIMLFTDGLFEVEAPNDELYSRERLISAVRQRVGLPSSELISELFADIRRFSNRSEFSDDVCLVGLEVARLCGSA